MKKFATFKQRLPLKLYLLVALFLIVYFFSNDFGLVDIQKTALILAAGIDRDESGYILTAQIAAPQTQQESADSGIQVQGTGQTISDCIATVYSETGWVPKFIFCDLLVLGENAAKQNAMDCLDFFLRNEYISDSCQLAVCEGDAATLISTKSTVDDTSSAAIGKLFSDAAQKSGKVSTCTLKDFSIGYYGVSHSGHMPYLRIRPSAEENVPTASGSGSGGGSSGDGGGGTEIDNGSQEQGKVFCAEETCLFLDGKLCAILPAEQTLAYQLLEGEVFSGTFTVSVDGKPCSLTVLHNKGEVSLSMKGAPKAILSLTVTVRLFNRGNSSDVEDLINSESTAGTKAEAQALLTSYIESLWQSVLSSKCDLFYLKRQLYRSSLKEYATWKETLLLSLTPQIDVKIKGVN